MNRGVLLTPLVVAFAAPLLGQSPPPADKPVSFEVASIKANNTRVGVRGHSYPGNRFEARNVPTRDLLMIAYGEAGQMLPESWIVGPTWIDEERFDISAVVSRDVPNTVAQKQLALRALLLDRFKLGLHFESRDVPAYALTLLKADGTLGPHLHRSDGDCELELASNPGQSNACIFSMYGAKLMVRGQSIAALASVLTRVFDRPVIDKTGLVGGFDADLEYDPQSIAGTTPAAATGAASDLPSFTTALREGLGLTLDSTRARINVLVIDHIERPTGN